jgi:hypothetical protein
MVQEERRRLWKQVLFGGMQSPLTKLDGFVSQGKPARAPSKIEARL